MADNLAPGDGVPSWLVAVLSVVSTVVGWRAWQPLGRWLSHRIEADRQIRAVERGDLVAQLKAQLQATATEMLDLRKDLGEERELRMALAVDNAVLAERVKQVEAKAIEDKEECRQEIRRLRTEIGELRRQLRGPQA